MSVCWRLGRFRPQFSHLLAFLIPIVVWRCLSVYTATQCLDVQLRSRSLPGDPPYPRLNPDIHILRKPHSKPDSPKSRRGPTPERRIAGNVTISTAAEQLYFRALGRSRRTSIVEIRFQRNATCHSQLPPEKPCIDRKCPVDFPLKRDRQSLHAFLAGQLPVPKETLRQIQGIAKGDKRRRLVIVTAASSNHFMETQGLLKNLDEVLFPMLKKSKVDFRLIFYDLGLSAREREVMETYCKCEVKTLQDDKFPRHVRNLYCFAWKPVMVAAHLASADMLLWVDSSVRFLTGNLTAMFQEVRESHVLLSRSVYNLAQSVHPDMLRYYGDQACLYSSIWEFEMNLVLFHNDAFTRELVVSPWLSCAFARNCMCPAGSSAMPRCDRSVRMYSKCHRFDQASMNIILLKLMGEKMPLVTIPKTIFHTVKRGDTFAYFPEQP